jgi:hypothetical protein
MEGQTLYLILHLYPIFYFCAPLEAFPIAIAGQDAIPEADRAVVLDDLILFFWSSHIERMMIFPCCMPREMYG